MKKIYYAVYSKKWKQLRANDNCCCCDPEIALYKTKAEADYNCIINDIIVKLEITKVYE